jgi:hypothetical protein
MYADHETGDASHPQESGHVDLSKLTELKRILHEAKNFATVWDYFLTNFGEQPEFMKHGEPVREDELLQLVIREVCKGLFPDRDAILLRSRLIRIAEYKFVHGSLFLDDRLSGMLYFEDDHKGMMAVCWSANPPETKYARFTGRALFDSLRRSEN